jgi:hypothetical protein
VETSHRIAQILGVPTAYLYCEDDDLAEVILAWSKLARGGRAQAKKAVLGLVAGRQGRTNCSPDDGMLAGLSGKRSLAAYRYLEGRLFFSDDGKPPEAAGQPSARVS